MDVQTKETARFSVPSIIAIVAAIASFPMGTLFGFILALVALVFGVIGFTVSLSPRVRGGVVSILATLGGVLGIVAALIKGISALF
jgi:hypothetical protein